MNPSPAPLPAWRLLLLCRMNPANIIHHLRPLLASPRVVEVTLIRHTPLPLDHPKLRQCAYGIDPGRGPGRPLKLLAHLFAFFLTGLRQTWRRRPHALIAIYPLPYGMITQLIGLLTGRPVVIMVVSEGAYLRRHYPDWLFRLMRWSVSRAAAVTVAGEAIKAELAGMGFPPERLHPLPHTIDLELFAPPAEAFRPFHLLFVGALLPNKRPGLLLEAMALLKERHPHLKLALAGEGPLRPELERRCLALGLQGMVTFFGAVAEHDLIRLLHHARLFVLPSASEGLPFALIEAMAAGLVPVVTEVGAVGEVVRDRENGLLMPCAAGAGAWAEALATLLEDDQWLEALRQGGRETLPRFRHHHAATVWEGILEKVGGEAPSPS